VSGFFSRRVVNRHCASPSDFFRSLHRPLGDGRVNFRHEADRLTQGRNDFAVAFQVIVCESPATAVLEPFPTNLIRAGWKREGTPFARFIRPGQAARVPKSYSLRLALESNLCKEVC
jgi:hypothetical protein